jgi:hypothetical protein
VSELMPELMMPAVDCSTRHPDYDESSTTGSSEAAHYSDDKLKLVPGDQSITFTALFLRKRVPIHPLSAQSLPSTPSERPAALSSSITHQQITAVRATSFYCIGCAVKCFRCCDVLANC